MNAYMLDCARIIGEECAAGATQKTVALSYAFAIKADADGIEKQPWQDIHDSIRSRWGDKGIERVKAKAWKLIRNPAGEEGRGEG